MITSLTRDRFLLLTTGLSVLLHVMGLILAVIGMRPGTPAMALESRMSYLAQQPILWIAGWAVWMLCALVLIANIAAFSTYLKNAALGNTAIALTVSGAAIDLFCDLIYIILLPRLAAGAPESILMFKTFERLAGAAGMVVANGFYVLAILLVTIGLRSDSRTPAGVIWLGYATFLFGFCMVAAGFTGVPWHLEFATGPAIGCFMLWQLGAAYSLTRKAEA